MSEWRPFEPCAENVSESRRKQCEAVAFRGGWNCCQLERGHEGEHQSDGGCTAGPWGAREEVQDFLASKYHVPARRRR